MKIWVTQLRKGLLEFCVLNVLTKDESYGYEIVQRLKNLKEMVITESTVYPILSRLRKDDYLTVRAEPSQDGPPRRYFALTVKGKIRVKKMNEYWDSLSKSIDKIRKGEE